MFWIVKSCSTALGESTSDLLVHRLGPVPAVALGFFAFVVALVRQLRTRRYRPGSYWLAVLGVGVFGTMAADVVHVGLGVAYQDSTVAFGCVLAAVLIAWRRTEGTLDMHTITTTRRELFYWATVVATFALGTAAGDLTSVALHFGYLRSIALFASTIAIPAVGFSAFSWNEVFSFWFAYILTRPLGASVADAFGKPTVAGGLGVGAGTITAALALAMVALVALTAKRERERTGRGARAHLRRATAGD